jgi:hypothetical protein
MIIRSAWQEFVWNTMPYTFAHATCTGRLLISKQFSEAATCDSGHGGRATVPPLEYNHGNRARR